MGRAKLPREDRICPTCKEFFSCAVTSNRKFCTPKCYHKFPKSEEWRRKQSEGHKGRKYNVTPEGHQRSSESKRGNKNPMKRPEVREKVSASKKGKTLEELGHGPDCTCCMCRAKRGRQGERIPIGMVKNILMSTKNYYENPMEEIVGID